MLYLTVILLYIAQEGCGLSVDMNYERLVISEMLLFEEVTLIHDCSPSSVVTK